MKVGMYGGKFLPLHQGHVSAIIEASTICDELYVVLSYNEEREKLLFEDAVIDPIPYRERFKWLSQLTQDMENVKVIAVSDDAVDEESYDWVKGAEDIKKAIGKEIDVVFHSDPLNYATFRELYPRAMVITFNRNNIPISATMIRKEGAYKHWEYIPKVVRPYFVKKICIVGTESCGKSTLVKNLARHFNTEYVEEYGRVVCDEVGGAENMTIKDFPRIAYGHKMMEFEKLKIANKVLIIDTDSIVTKYYGELYADTVEEEDLYTMICKNNDYDLYMFLEPDVPWVQDGTRLHGEQEIRLENNKKLKKMLIDAGISYLTIKGTYDQRFNKAKSIIQRLIEN